jgi:FAD/FMN-containing dehydrogenase
MMNTDFTDLLKQAIGAQFVITDPVELEPYFKEYRGRYQGTGMAVVKPGTTQEVSAIVKLCAAHKISIVPQGGNTSLVGGSIPYQNTSIVINTSRLNKIRNIDADNFTMTVDAGCILATIQQKAADANRFFPLSLGAEGSCQIGGNISSNAGGIYTIRYGNCRDLVLGIEAVLPNGDIWNGLRSLRKDNTGYDLKHLFIGAEGSLGIITGAVLKLFPIPATRETFLVAVNGPEQALELLSRTRAVLGDSITAFELIARPCVELALEVGPKCIDPLEQKTDWMVLAELSAGQERVETFLGTMLEENVILDATIAANEQQRSELWFLREAIVEAQRHAGGSIKHDISVPVSKIPEFIHEATAFVHTMIEGVRPVIFGHMGDGNLHFNLTQPRDADRETYLERWDEITHAVHDIVQKYNGSFSAEHGVGVFKAGELAQRKSSVEMALMRQIKHALDPHNLMNPGKVLTHG